MIPAERSGSNNSNSGQGHDVKSNYGIRARTGVYFMAEPKLFPGVQTMPKFLLQANYTAEGLRGVMKDTAVVREARIREMIAGVGGTLDGFYFALGDTDVFVICELPDVATCASLALSVSASGVVHVKTTALLTAAETDAAIRKGIIYRPPGA
jgi:uncharacterized protein with GYD domain